MRYFKFFWTTHKWTGIVLAVVFLNISVTGFLLLSKKEYSWIQPPTQVASNGGSADWLPVDQLLAVVWASDVTLHMRRE